MPDYTLDSAFGSLLVSGRAATLTPSDTLPQPCPSSEMRPRGYTCQICMERLFSEDGIFNRVDDGIDIPAQNKLIADCIADATDDINQYCLPLYPEPELYKSRWVSRRACYLACYYLSQRRGNPAQYQSQYDRITDELRRVQRYQLQIPRLRPRHELTPSLSNIIVDDRYPQDSLRVVVTNKYGTDYTGQHLDYPIGSCGCGYW